MKKRKIIIPCILAVALFFCLTGTIYAGDPGSTSASSQVSFNGKVTDFQTGESLVGAEVFIPNTQYRTYTDLDGNFSFKNLPDGNYNLVISLISYNKSLLEDIKVEKGSSHTQDVRLIPNH